MKKQADAGPKGTISIGVEVEPWNVHLAGAVNGLASVVDGHRVEVWDLDTGLAKHSFRTVDIGLAVASAADRCVVSIEGGFGVRSLAGLPISDLADPVDSPFETPFISPDGAFVVGVTENERLIWDAATGAPVHRAEEPELYRGCFTPDGRRFVAVIRRGEALEIVDLVTGESQSLAPFDTDPLCSNVVISPRGARVAIAARRSVTVLELASGRVLRKSITTKDIGGCAMVDEETVLLALTNRIVACSVASGDVVGSVEVPAENVLVVPNPPRVIAITSNGIRIFPTSAIAAV